MKKLNKKFEAPVVEVVKFESSDVIATSIVEFDAPNMKRVKITPKKYYTK